MAMALEPFFFTPPPAPRHLAELRIEPALSAVAFSAPCAADAERKRRCLLPASSVRKRMLLELPPFDPAPGTPMPPPSPMASRAAGPSFAPVLRPIHPTATAGNMFAFGESAPTTPGGSEASSAANMFAFLAAPERPDTPTGPTPRGGFLFAAASSERPLTPTSKGSNTSGLSFLASPKQPSLMPTGMLSPAKETKLPPVGLATPSFVFSASRVAAAAAAQREQEATATQPPHRDGAAPHEPAAVGRRHADAATDPAAAEARQVGLIGQWRALPLVHHFRAVLFARNFSGQGGQAGSQYCLQRGIPLAGRVALHVAGEAFLTGEAEQAGARGGSVQRDLLRCRGGGAHNLQVWRPQRVQLRPPPLIYQLPCPP